MRRLVAPALAVLLTAACGPAPTPVPDSPAPETLAAETPRRADPKLVWTGGAGPLSGEVAFDRTAVAALFPDATEVKSEYLQGAGMSVGTSLPIITVQGPGDRMLEVQGAPDGKVGVVIILGGDLRGPRGETLGAGWGDLGFVPSDCAPGEGRFLHNPVCRRAGQPNVAYVFAVQRWTRDEVPDPTTLVSRGSLDGMIWTRP